LHSIVAVYQLSILNARNFDSTLLSGFLQMKLAQNDFVQGGFSEYPEIASSTIFIDI